MRDTEQNRFCRIKDIGDLLFEVLVCGANLLCDLAHFFC